MLRGERAVNTLERFLTSVDGLQAFPLNGFLFKLFAPHMYKKHRSVFRVVIYVAHKGWLKGKVTPEFLQSLFDCFEPRGTN